jgi:hypothetical protein
LGYSGRVTQRRGCAHDQVHVGRYWGLTPWGLTPRGLTPGALDSAVCTHFEGELIAQVDELKGRLQLVIAIRTAAEDM